MASQGLIHYVLYNSGLFHFLRMFGSYLFHLLRMFRSRINARPTCITFINSPHRSHLKKHLSNAKILFHRLFFKQIQSRSRVVRTRQNMAVSQQSRLLALPREIRDEILFQIIYPNEGTLIVSDMNPKILIRTTPNLGLSLLRINKQLEVEGRQALNRVFASVPRFVLELDVQSALRYLSHLPRDTLQSIRSLWIPAWLVRSMCRTGSCFLPSPTLTTPSNSKQRLALFDFVQSNMRLHSISIDSAKLSRYGWPSYDVLFSLAKLLHEGVLQQVCLFYNHDPFWLSLPLSDSYDESERPTPSSPWGGHSPKLRWSNSIPRIHPTNLLVMTEDLYCATYTATQMSYVTGCLDTKRFEYPMSCIHLFIYTRNPALGAKTWPTLDLRATKLGRIRKLTFEQKKIRRSTSTVTTNIGKEARACDGRFGRMIYGKMVNEGRCCLNDTRVANLK